MDKYEVLQLRKIIAESEFTDSIICRLNELKGIYASNMASIEKLAQTTEDYELLTSALWDAYEHELQVLKDLCVVHGISKGKMLAIFK